MGEVPDRGATGPRTSWIEGLRGRAARFQERIVREAEAEGLAPLTVEHWAVIQLVLDSYLAKGEVPVAVRIGRAVGITARRLSQLFPAGAAKTACRLARLELPPDVPSARSSGDVN